MAKITKAQAIAELKRRKQKAMQSNDSEDESGWSGVADDVGKSIAGLPGAAMDMMAALPGQLKETGKQIVNDPSRAYANLGAGVGEGAIGMANLPANIAKYLASKKIISDKTAGNVFRIPDLGFEKAIGLDDQQPGDALLRMPGQFLSPAKLAGILPLLGKTAKAGVAGGLMGAGQDEDPIQAALLTSLMAKAGKTGMNAIKGISQGVNRAAGVAPPPTPSAGASPTGGAPVSPLPIPPATPAPSGVAWNAQPPSSVSWMKNIPQAALNVAAEVPKTAKKIAKKVPEVAANTAASALEFGDDMLSQLPAVGKTVGKVSNPLLGALSSYLKHIAVPPEEMAQRKLFGDIKPSELPRIQERVEAAQRAGLDHITPAEATLRALEGRKQGDIGRTPEGMDLLNERGEARTASEKKAITDFMDTIYHEKLSPQMEAAYNSTMEGRVPHSFIVEHSKLPVVEEAIKKVQGNSAYRQMLERELGVPLDIVNPKIFRYWDMIKRVLYDMEEAKKSKTGKATTASTEIARTRQKMVEQMDAIKPEYEVARNISEREHTREKLRKHFNARKRTLNELHKYLNNEDNYTELLHKLRGLPEAKAKLKDLHLLAGNMIQNDMNIRAAAALKRTGMSDARNQLDAAKRDLDERFGQDHDVETVRLMTDPNWHKALLKYLKEKGK